MTILQSPTWARRYENKVAVVTGSSSGHGRAIALRLAREGAALVCVDLRKEPLAGGFEADAQVDTDDVIRKLGGRATFVQADVTSPDQLSAVGEAAISEFGRLDVWVNNAGVSLGFASILDESDEQFERTMEINLKGTWNGAREAVRRMVGQEPAGRVRGRIVNIGSIAGSIGQKNLGGYSASKGAVHNLTWNLAIELAESLITVNTVAPGYFPTAMNRGLWDDPEALAEVQALHPLPLGVPDDIAAAVAFLGSPDADFITGATLPVDGGMAAK
jgi:NAD(P)-dependent dehydrogenase (short-subunit alcohol dehydrogenase family)